MSVSAATSPEYTVKEVARGHDYVTYAVSFKPQIGAADTNLSPEAENAALRCALDVATRELGAAIMRHHIDAERAAVKDAEVQQYIDKCREMSNNGEYAWWSRLADILSTLSPAESEPEQGAVPVGYLFKLRYGPDRWSHQDMFSDCLPTNPDDVKDVRPVYTRPPSVRAGEETKRPMPAGVMPEVIEILERTVEMLQQQLKDCRASRERP